MTTPLPQLTWLDQLGSAEIRDVPGTLDVHATMAVTSAVLAPRVIDWALGTAAKVAADVEEIRRSAAAVRSEEERQAAESACAAGVLTTLASLRSGTPVSHAPDEMLKQVRDAYHRGADLASILRFVWNHHSRFEEQLLLAQRRFSPEDQSGGQLQDLHTRMHEILDVYLTEADAAYEAEKERWGGSQPTRRRALLVSVLEGEPAPVDPERELGLSLEDHYVFISLSQPGEDGHAVEEEDIDLLYERATLDLGATGGFTQHMTFGEYFWCFTFDDPEILTDRVKVRLGKLAPAGLAMGVGPLSRGAHQLAWALRGAADARSIAAHPARPAKAPGSSNIVHFDDVQVLPLINESEERLSAFVSHCLGPLASDTQKNADLRRTLLMYLLHGRSRKEAARILHISPNTVAYRIDQARDLIGPGLRENSVELLLSLHILDILPGLVSPVTPENARVAP